MNGTEPDSTSSAQTNSIFCERCGRRAEVKIREARSTLAVDIPLGWTTTLVTHEVGPALCLFIEYMCQQCNIEVHWK